MYPTLQTTLCKAGVEGYQSVTPYVISPKVGAAHCILYTVCWLCGYWIWILYAVCWLLGVVCGVLCVVCGVRCVVYCILHLIYCILYAGYCTPFPLYTVHSIIQQSCYIYLTPERGSGRALWRLRPLHLRVEGRHPFDHIQAVLRGRKTQRKVAFIRRADRYV
jgi:hypothetical protein